MRTVLSGSGEVHLRSWAQAWRWGHWVSRERVAWGPDLVRAASPRVRTVLKDSVFRLSVHSMRLMHSLLLVILVF